jgi:alpha-beta hydrolase superfamily lysophospholipase
MFRRPVAQIALLAAIGVLGASALRPGALVPEPTEPGDGADGDAFVVRVGADTLAVERFSRTGGRLEGELVDLGSGNLRESYVATLESDGRVARFEVAYRPGNAARDTPPVRRAALTFRADGDVEEARGSGLQEHRRIGASPGVLPYLELSNALLEQATMRARAMGGERVELPLLDVNGGRTFTAVVTLAGADSMQIRLDGVEVRVQVDSAGLILGGRVPDRDVTIERVVASETAALGPPNYSAPLDAPYSAEEVRVRATARHSLAGTLTLPTDSPGPFPAVVLVSGSGAQERDGTYLGTYRPFRQIADALSRRGVAVLRLDDRGVGASTGSFTLANSADFADDVRAALVYLRGRRDIDGERVGLVGESEGGLIASMVAATDSELRALVLMGTPSRTGRSLITSQVRYRLERDDVVPLSGRDSVVAAVEARNERLARFLPWLKFILDYDPIPTAVRVPTPVLILQGGTDRQVAPHQADELAVAFRSGGNQDVTVRVFENLNHLFLEDADGDPERYGNLRSKSLPPGVLAAIADWVAGHLL